MTGAGRNIGKAIALALADEGARLIINDVDLESANRVAEEIRSLGNEAVAVKADVSKYKETKNLLDATVKRYNSVNILVNNAGLTGTRFGGEARAETLSPERWTKMIEVNINGPFFCSQIVGGEMIKNGTGGKIINVASVYGLEASPFMIDYVTSKHGVVGLTKALAVEWGRYRINVNCICPSLTLTDKLNDETLNSTAMKSRINRIPLTRLTKPKDIAEAAVFLASDHSDYITGSILCIDGGSSALYSGYPIPQ